MAMIDGVFAERALVGAVEKGARVELLPLFATDATDAAAKSEPTTTSSGIADLIVSYANYFLYVLPLGLTDADHLLTCRVCVCALQYLVPSRRRACL